MKLVVVVLLVSLINIPFFPYPFSVFAFGFCIGIATAMAVAHVIDQEKQK